MQMLKLHCVGPEVRQLQYTLNRTLNIRPALALDGIFGSLTRAAVVEFQDRCGLVEDGIVGPKTTKALILVALQTAERGYHPWRPFR
jgi:peptidoglycan hydrolase-like protein with peptidoglycan-binding domain